MQELEETYDLAISGYLEPEGRESLVREALERVRAVREGENHLGRECAKELAGLEGKLRRVKGRSKPRGFQGLTAREVGIYREVFQALVELTPSPGAAKEVIEAVVERAGKALARHCAVSRVWMPCPVRSVRVSGTISPSNNRSPSTQVRPLLP